DPLLRKQVLHRHADHDESRDRRYECVTRWWLLCLADLRRVLWHDTLCDIDTRDDRRFLGVDDFDALPNPGFAQLLPDDAGDGIHPCLRDIRYAELRRIHLVRCTHAGYDRNLTLQTLHDEMNLVADRIRCVD